MACVMAAILIVLMLSVVILIVTAIGAIKFWMAVAITTLLLILIT